MDTPEKDDLPIAAEKKLSPELKARVRTAGKDQLFSVIVRISTSRDENETRSRFEEAGLKVQSYGRGSITGGASPRTLLELCAIPWVQSIESPRQFDLKMRNGL